MSPRALFRRLAVAEAITWALLLVGMFLKYVTDTTELGVRIFGMLHGVVFIAYCLGALLVGVDQRWSLGRRLGALASAVPPFATLGFERYADRRGLLGDAWSGRRETAAQRLATWLVAHPVQGAVAGLGAVAALTGLALLLGPPTA